MGEATDTDGAQTAPGFKVTRVKVFLLVVDIVLLAAQMKVGLNCPDGLMQSSGTCRDVSCTALLLSMENTAKMAELACDVACEFANLL